MRRPFRASALAGAALIVLVPCAAIAQAIGGGFDLERAGQPEMAATRYFSTLRGDPTNLSALLGLERVLPPLQRTSELLPLVQRAIERDSANSSLRGLLVRTYVALDMPDSATAFAGRWARSRPHDEEPYREWALALVDRHSNTEARRVLLAGRQALGGPPRFAPELAALAQQAGDWEGAAQEWVLFITAVPVQAQAAAGQLADAPAEQREPIIHRLTARDAPPAAQRLAAELVLGWGDPARAWTIFEATVDEPSPETSYALRRFADLAGAFETPAAWRVRGLALSRFANSAPQRVAVRVRVEAARSFLQAGDAAAARGELERVAADGGAPPDAQRIATLTLIGALIGEGQLDTAAARLQDARYRLGADDRAALGAALARARIRRGELTLADSVLANDSSVQALALHGWIALYRGDLHEARAKFRAAGPYAGERREATERTAMLALIERIPRDSFPALGRALLTLARRDSAVAVTELRRAAEELTPEQGRGDALLVAGRICARLGAQGEATAIVLFAEVVRIGGKGSAPPAAELAWAELLIQQKQLAPAITHLENVILNYPESAVVPEARRRLDAVKGATPKS
jgi:hypothetical protein